MCVEMRSYGVENKTKEQLIEENLQLRRQIDELYQKDKLQSILASLVENLPNGIIVTDLESRIIYVNKTAEQFSDYSRQELIGQYPEVLNCEENAEEIQQQIIASMQSNKNWSGELQQRRKDGSQYRAELEMFPVQLENGNVVAWASIQRDIEAEERYRQLLQLSPDAIAVHTEGKFVYVNDIGVQLLGARSSQELIGKPVMDIVHSDSCQLVAERVQQMLASGKALPLTEEKYIKLDGTTIDVEIASAPLIFHGKPLILAVVRDITERKHIMEALKSAQRDKELILQSISELVVYHDLNMFIRWANHNHYKSDGMTPDQLVGHQCFKIWQQRENPCPGCPVKKTLSTGRFDEGEITDSINGRTLMIKAYPVMEGQDIVGVVEVARDITKQKQLEIEMARFERLNLIGQMAAGIGHEIRNPMTTVRGFLQILNGKEGLAAYKDYFDLMLEELDRANNIITQYLSLAKNKPTEKRKHNINTILQTLFPLIQADVFKSDMNLTLELQSIPDLDLDEKEIRQLILNLARNGIEAMSPGGNLTIKTYSDGDEVILAVKDNGSGIDQSILKDIGTPFFTTKDNGTGLGLAVCYSIAARHSAKIEVKSSCNGTTFFVCFHQTTSCGVTV